jgi:hypothetical protein
MTKWSLWRTIVQLDYNLKFEIWKVKFGKDTHKQATYDNKSIDLPLLSMALMGHCEQVIILKNYNAITLQLETWNLKYEKLKFEQDMQKQTTCGNKSIDLPLCINNLHVPMAIFKKFKMNYKGEGLYFLKHFVHISLRFFMIQLWCYMLHCFVSFCFFVFNLELKMKDNVVNLIVH